MIVLTFSRRRPPHVDLRHCHRTRRTRRTRWRPSEPGGGLSQRHAKLAVQHDHHCGDEQRAFRQSARLGVLSSGLHQRSARYDIIWVHSKFPMQRIIHCPPSGRFAGFGNNFLRVPLACQLWNSQERVYPTWETT